MIRLSSSRIIEGTLWRIVGKSYSGPRKQNDHQNAKHFSLHSSI